jgi:hypothetical protein
MTRQRIQDVRRPFFRTGRRRRPEGAAPRDVLTVFESLLLAYPSLVGVAILVVAVVVGTALAVIADPTVVPTFVSPVATPVLTPYPGGWTP